MAWLLFPLSVGLGVLVSVAYKQGSQRVRGLSQIPFLMFVPATLLALCFGIISAFSEFGTKATLVLPALLSGVSTALAMYSLFRSMKDGNFAVTVVFANMSFCIPIFLAWIILKEQISLWQLGGILLLLAMIVVVNFVGKPKGEKGAKKGSKGWLVWAVGACLFNGLMNFGVRLQQHFTPGELQLCFNFYNFLFCAIASCILFALVNCRKQSRVPLERADVKRLLLPCAILAAGCGVNFYVQSLLPQFFNASVQFTVCNGGALLLGVLIGTFYYKEKFSWQSAVTLACSAAAIALQVI